jgi:3-oxoacyl-[acyl-carrier protein] reductase
MKRALVTGGSGDIGHAICKQLAIDRFHVYVHANKHLSRAEQIVAEIKASGGSAEAIAFDVTDADETNKALESVLAQGEIQVLVNNAGLHDDAIMAGMNITQWRRVIDVCLNGFYYVTQPILLPMMATRWGRIINISSIAGVMGNRGQTNYAAAKAGLIGATKSLAIELASRGITVNAIAPGIIHGKMTAEVFDNEKLKQLVPMQRAGKPEEVAALVSFLASDFASYISGQVIGVNGAMV